MYKYKSLQAGQLPQEHLSFLQKMLNFIIAKFLKQEVDDNLSICVDKHNPCAYNWRHKDLSIWCDQRVMKLLSLMEKVLWTSSKEMFLLSKFDNSSPSVPRDKEICPSHMIMRWWCHYLLRESTQWTLLNEVYQLSISVSSFSMTGRFCWLWAVQNS